MADLRPISMDENGQFIRIGDNDRTLIRSLNLGVKNIASAMVSSGTIAKTASFQGAISFSKVDLHTITGGEIGDVLYLSGLPVGDVVTVVDTGNIKVHGKFKLDNSQDKILHLLFNGNNWIELGRAV